MRLSGCEADYREWEGAHDARPSITRPAKTIEIAYPSWEVAVMLW
jgi:hypothetical protein